MILVASNPKPVKNLAVVAIVLSFTFLVLQVVDLLLFPSYLNFNYSGGYPGTYIVEFYTYFQYIARYGLNYTGYTAGYGIYMYVNINAQGLRQYLGIPLAAICAFYALARWRDPTHLLDKDHARHMLLLGYFLLIVSFTPFMKWYSFYEASRIIGFTIEDVLMFVFFSFLPQIAYIAFALVIVLVFHMAINRASQGVI